jgi:hypothetical protein
MITFKFEDLETGRKQDINCFDLNLEDKSTFVSDVDCYVYNTVLERIEFFGVKTYYYNHENREWVRFELSLSNEDYCLECVEIVIK